MARAAEEYFVPARYGASQFSGINRYAGGNRPRVPRVHLIGVPIVTRSWDSGVGEKKLRSLNNIRKGGETFMDAAVSLKSCSSGLHWIVLNDTIRFSISNAENW